MSYADGGRDGETCPGFRPFIPGQIDLGGIVLGTTVRTAEGEMPIEYLEPGDRIITRNSGAAPLMAMEYDTVVEQAVEFTIGSMDHECPPQALIVPASQPILLRDWRAQVMFGQPQAVTLAGLLVDHGIILDRGEQEMTLFRPIFERDQVIYAGGLELTSAPILERKRRAA